MTNHKIATCGWPSNSAVYHVVPGSIFLKDKLAFIVKYLLEDAGNRTLNLQNPERVKRTIFLKIQELYKKRIDCSRIGGSHLMFNRLTNESISNLSLKKIKVSKSEDQAPDLSGRFQIYPRTFVCSDCNTFYIFEYKNKPIPLRCNCGGEFEQLSVVKFCKDCGKVDQLFPHCHECASKKLNQGQMKLSRRIKDSIITWKWICSHGHKEDILQAFCNHQDMRNPVNPYLLPLSTPNTRFEILTIRENSVFTPLVMTTIDIKDTGNIDLNELEIILFGINLGKFSKFEKDAKEENLTLLQWINKKYQEYYSKDIKKAFFDAYKMLSLKANDDEIEEKFKERCKIGEIRNILDLVGKNFPPDVYDQEEFNNYSSLKGIFSNELNFKSYTDLTSNDKTKQQEWLKLKSKFKIQEITYLEKIRLVSAAIGLIRGVSDESSIPHFEPLWNHPMKKDKFSAYVNPYDTEGILIDFNKPSIYNWLKENGFLSEELTDLSPEEVLLSMNLNSKEYHYVKTLLHTLCHVLIKKSSLYTGIDPNSCSEMIFPNSGAIMIYSTSNINIGGFGHIFENYLYDLFTESDFEIRQCIYDPVCNSNDGSTGACFSCMFLPEHVCRYHNQELDRDILKKEWRYKSTFW